MSARTNSLFCTAIDSQYSYVKKANDAAIMNAASAPIWHILYQARHKHSIASTSNAATTPVNWVFAPELFRHCRARAAGADREILK